MSSESAPSTTGIDFLDRPWADEFLRAAVVADKDGVRLWGPIENPSPPSSRSMAKVLSVSIPLTETLEEFVRGRASDASVRGIFLPFRTPQLVTGTLTKFKIILGNGHTALEGVGRIRWTRDADRPPRGMGLGFIKLTPPSSALMRHLVETRCALRIPSRFEDGFPFEERMDPEQELAWLASTRSGADRVDEALDLNR